MTLISWNPTLSVGVKQLDDQHKVLLGIANDLHTAMAEGKGSQVLGPILDGLVEYTRTHFADEEQLLARHGFPGLHLQAEQHRMLVGRVLELQQKFKAGKILLSVELMGFLKEWLITHIQVEDAQYAPFLRSKCVR
jgi:hemerythrin